MEIQEDEFEEWTQEDILNYVKGLIAIAIIYELVRPKDGNSSDVSSKRAIRGWTEDWRSASRKICRRIASIWR